MARRFLEDPPKGISSPRVAWIRLKPEPLRVPVMRRTMSHYGIPVESAPTIELVTPRLSLEWSREVIAARFPQLSPCLDPSGRGASMAVEAAIKANPKLLAYATALWRLVGRGRDLSPEALVRHALGCLDLGWWSAGPELAGGLTAIDLAPRQNPLEALTVLRSGAVTLRFRGEISVSAARWVLNCQLSEWKALCVPSGPPVVLGSVGQQTAVGMCAVPIPIETATGALPSPLKPLTLYLSQDQVPDADAVIPLEFRPKGSGRELWVWVNVGPALDLDTALSRFRDSLGRLRFLFPGLESGTLAMPVPADVETCYSDDVRQAALERLETSAREVYSHSSLHAQTRHPSVWALFPSLHCHLPYPEGTVGEASRILRLWVGKRPAVRAAREAESPPPGYGP